MAGIPITHGNVVIPSGGVTQGIAFSPRESALFMPLRDLLSTVTFFDKLGFTVAEEDLLDLAMSSDSLEAMLETLGVLDTGLTIDEITTAMQVEGLLDLEVDC